MRLRHVWRERKRGGKVMFRQRWRKKIRKGEIWRSLGRLEGMVVSLEENMRIGEV